VLALVLALSRFPLVVSPARQLHLTGDRLCTQDIERYCEETQADDADCEEDSAQTGVLVLVIYQATQMLSLWAAWSLYVGVRDPSVSPTAAHVVHPVQQPMQPQQAYAMPVAAAPPSTASHGNDMAAAAGKHKHGNGKHRKESGNGKHRKGDKHKRGEGEFEPSSWDTPSGGKGGKVCAALELRLPSAWPLLNAIDRTVVCGGVL
jgi:hypothetical protein